MAVLRSPTGSGAAPETPQSPVLVFVGVTDLKVVATQLGVRVYQERQVAALAPLSGVLTAEQVEQVTASPAIARRGSGPQPVSLGEVSALSAKAVGSLHGVTGVGAGCPVSAVLYAPLLIKRFGWGGDTDGRKRVESHGPVSA